MNRNQFLGSYTYTKTVTTHPLIFVSLNLKVAMVWLDFFYKTEIEVTDVKYELNKLRGERARTELSNEAILRVKITSNGTPETLRSREFFHDAYSKSSSPSPNVKDFKISLPREI